MTSEKLEKWFQDGNLEQRKTSIYRSIIERIKEKQPSNPIIQSLVKWIVKQNQAFCCL